MQPPRAFICAEHGLAVVYFLQSDLVGTLLEGGVEIVLLSPDGLQEKLRHRFGRPGLTFEGMRLSRVRAYEQRRAPELQWWLGFLRRVGGSRRINTAAMDSYVRQVAVEESNWRRMWMPLALAVIAALKRSRAARQGLIRLQERFTDEIYDDLLERHRPSLVISSTPAWRLDRYLLREARRRGIRTAAAVIGWDNPSSYSIPGSRIDNITCWSEVQKKELVQGSDWDPAQVHIGGIPIYDGYLRREWQLPRSTYFQLHGLDPARKLIGYACSFVSFSPNFQNVQALADLVSEDRLVEPCQLLIRLHPNHFLDVHLYRAERQAIRRLAAERRWVHVVEPVPLGEELGHYSGEDMAEKASMMAYSDVFVTVYSTMVVEAGLHDRPIISACLDAPRGWDWPRKYSLPLSRIGDWPTHQRFRQAGAGMEATNPAELREAINASLRNPQALHAQRKAFVQREITFTDGSAGRRTGEYLLSLVEQGDRVRDDA